ncbi:LysR family transcriptional regulator [Frateuria defendens]|uniref:LysR family transcriptional regulator n=1 Tax=Frateuria defendens TaxID=2219559 RepID=UPI00066FD446|nr:LysR family transcriptional regulator [Frateuria defendens]
MTLRYLRYFVVIAEELHLTRAAERLQMAQPPLSQQLRKLEQHVGTPLFRRYARGLELTAAGRSLYRDAVHILELSQRATDKARSIGAGLGGRIVVGFCSSTVFEQRLAELIRDYRAQYPEVTLSPVEDSSVRLVERLREGELDAAVIRLPCAGIDDFARQDVLSEDMLLALPPGHRLERRKTIALEEMADEALIVFPRATAPSLHDAIIASCQQAGFSPRLSQESSQVPSAINLVAAGFGYAIVPPSIRHIRGEDVSYHSIRHGRIRTHVTLLHRKGGHDQAVLNLAALIKGSAGTGRAARRA